LLLKVGDASDGISYDMRTGEREFETIGDVSIRKDEAPAEVASF